jgi:hypothetical protein
MFSDTTSDSASTRSGVAGYAFVGGICSSFRYSINEEWGGFQNIQVIAHEMGHKFV